VLTSFAGKENSKKKWSISIVTGRSQTTKDRACTTVVHSPDRSKKRTRPQTTIIRNCCDIPDAAILLKRAEEGAIRIVRRMPARYIDCMSLEGEGNKNTQSLAAVNLRQNRLEELDRTPLRSSRLSVGRINIYQFYPFTEPSESMLVRFVIPHGRLSSRQTRER